MSLPILKYRQWAKVFRKGGAVYLGRDALGHHKWSYVPLGEAEPQLAGLPAHHEGSDVLEIYPKLARKAWKLTAKDGVSDDDFLKGRWRKTRG